MSGMLIHAVSGPQSSVENWQLELWEESDSMMERAKVDILDALNQNPYLVQVPALFDMYVA